MPNLRYDDCRQCGWSNVVDRDSGVCNRCGDYPGKQEIKKKLEERDWHDSHDHITEGNIPEPKLDGKLCIVCDAPALKDKLYCYGCTTMQEESTPCFRCGEYVYKENVYFDHAADAFICKPCANEEKELTFICYECEEEYPLENGREVMGEMLCGDCLKEEESAVKFDQEKLRYDLIPPELLKAVSDILTFGTNKYGARNWEKGTNYSRIFAALMRHSWAWWSGEDNDPESGKSHLWHAACNIAFLLTYEAREVGEDDRPLRM